MEEGRVVAEPDSPRLAVAEVVRLPAWCRSLHRLSGWLSALNLLAALLATAGFHAAESTGLLPPGSASMLSFAVVGMAVFSILLLLLARFTTGRQVMAELERVEVSQRLAAAQAERRALFGSLSARLQQARSPDELARQLLSGLAPSLPMQQGLCCFWDEGSQSPTAAARYGAEGSSAAAVLERQPRIGPLLLEAARLRRRIVIAQPGPGYLRITSGLGDAEPAELLIQPIEHRGRLFAVLELASLRPLDEAARALLDEIAPVFAMCLDILQRAEHSEGLLEQARVALAAMPSGLRS
ncbi:GAF domain-containing protein [Malikia sp.]|uniref:GAF domain-containing protein n=1 Tax=Malikia sp. TaxID=2070706 RepID=UPI00260BE982|nr:GAF domain-containing protein [Malikia sp.]MDD2727683.1 GAF domain-containing protein [Malikia sp.]